ncbi:MAG: 4Fe-4S dicluster domain-containing protein [Desulfobacterales bacterium]|nr:4Fe-4S dicluster domain-containing protein [Desulfobacterales bacterium]
MREKAILVDISKCIACRGCQVACKQWNKLSAESTKNRGSYENPPALSENTLTRIIFQEVSDGKNLKWFFRKEQCMHCSKAACLELCPSDAIYKNQFGSIMLDSRKCIGCGVCEKFCPFHIPRINHTTHKAIKCSLCNDRVANGMQPACVKTCPTGALKFGFRDDILSSAHSKMNKSKKMYLYGENELGGLHIIYLLTQSPAIFNLPKHPTIPNPFEAYAFLMEKLNSELLNQNVLTIAALKYFGHIHA